MALRSTWYRPQGCKTPITMHARYKPTRRRPTQMLIQKQCTWKWGERLSISTDKWCPRTHLQDKYVRLSVLWLGSLLFSIQIFVFDQNEEENASFVMRCLVLLWCFSSKTRTNLVIHQLLPLLEQGLSFQVLFGRVTCVFSLWFHLVSLNSFENTSESNR